MLLFLNVKRKFLSDKPREKCNETEVPAETSET